MKPFIHDVTDIARQALEKIIKEYDEYSAATSLAWWTAAVAREVLAAMDERAGEP